MLGRPKAVIGGAARRYIITYRLKRKPDQLNTEPGDEGSPVYTTEVKTSKREFEIIPALNFLFRVGRGDEVGLGQSRGSDLICTSGTAGTEVTQVLPGQTPQP